MRTSDKRKYRAGEFGVNVGTNLDVSIFNELEEIARKFGTSRSHVLRELFNRGLAEYRRDGKLRATLTIEHDQAVISHYADIHK